MNRTVKTGQWPVVGRAPLDKGFTLPLQFIQDPLNKNSFSIYDNGQIRRATRQECIGLERAAVWEPEHVEERLRDHYAGCRNKWAESLRIEDDAENSEPGGCSWVN